MNRSFRQLDEIETERTDAGLLISHEWPLPITSSQRLFARVFFFIWNVMLGVFALAGIFMLVTLFFVDNLKAKDVVPFLLFLPLWYGLIYLFYRIGQSMSRAISGKRPFMGWSILITPHEWRSEYYEAWSERINTFAPTSISEISIDRKNRVTAQLTENSVKLTTPLSNEKTKWLKEKLDSILSNTT